MVVNFGGYQIFMDFLSMPQFIKFYMHSVYGIIFAVPSFLDIRISTCYLPYYVLWKSNCNEFFKLYK